MPAGWLTSGSGRIIRMAFNLYCNGTHSVYDYEEGEEQLKECRCYTVEDLFCFGESKKTVKMAIDRLEELCVVRREFRTVFHGEGLISNNVMYLKLVPEQLYLLTYPEAEPGSVQEEKARLAGTEEGMGGSLSINPDTGVEKLGGSLPTNSDTGVEKLEGSLLTNSDTSVEKLGGSLLTDLDTGMEKAGESLPTNSDTLWKKREGVSLQIWIPLWKKREVVPGISRACTQKRREYPPKMEGHIQRLLQRIHTEIIINLSFHLSVPAGQM